MTIYEKITGSAYQPKGEYPSYTVDQPKRAKLIKKYNLEKELLRETFYLDLCEHFNEKPSGRLKKIFEYSWKEAHSGGHKEIVMFMEELINLIKSLEKE